MTWKPLSSRLLRRILQSGGFVTTFAMVVSATWLYADSPRPDTTLQTTPVAEQLSPLKDIAAAPGDDPLARMQTYCVRTNQRRWGHWGPDPEKYSTWTTHTNRLIPVYTFGMNLNLVRGERSVYRDAGRLTKLYGRMPADTFNESAEYFDQTDIYQLQKSAWEAGKKRIILFVFDGMDWHMTRAAAIYKTNQVLYSEGRGKGLAFQDYDRVETDFGFMVTSPHNEGTSYNVDRQIVTNPGGQIPGGYDARRGGDTPWDEPTDSLYWIAKGDHPVKHAYTDSAASATSMTTGIKTYNDAINVDFVGREVLPISRYLQMVGLPVGVVTTVPISHATPACAYANNVSRGDYQDITRDLVGLPSSYHPGGIPGVDVLLGAGWGEVKDTDGEQGANFVPGNCYITDEDLKRINVEHGGSYVVAIRDRGKKGIDVLQAGLEKAKKSGSRLFGFFGTENGCLPFQTADGRYDPVDDFGVATKNRAKPYRPEDITENVTLADMAVTAAALLQAKSDKWWLMVEAGDVDKGSHANNIDTAIGAVFSGEKAFTALTEWIEQNGGWKDTVLILTADHGHYLVLTNPEQLCCNCQCESHTPEYKADDLTVEPNVGTTTLNGETMGSN